MNYIFILFMTTMFATIPQEELLKITYNGEQLTTINREMYFMPIFDNAMINHEDFNQLITTMEQKVYQKPKNAYIDENEQIIPGENGHTLDKEQFVEQFYHYFFSKDRQQIEVPVRHVYPHVDSELLANIKTKQIAQYVTYYNHNRKQRSHNIFLASEAINNHVVFPGETFSFNQVVGERTEEKGYLPAPEIVKGELIEGIGGGICQVSSTLYNAVDKIGVQMIERYSHSKHVPYVPKGRDATVSWYGPDFSFKNTLNQPLLIRSKTKEGKMIVEVYSSDILDYKIKSVPKASEDYLQDELEVNE
ncbi:VanW family protein [Gracilibacillus marinus]|uniref:VanW family protein n=1 Tax=Gracilibacillus marinus TaxID=630535 RepID=A0ABV8VVT2_9BACI